MKIKLNYIICFLILIPFFIFSFFSCRYFYLPENFIRKEITLTKIFYTFEHIEFLSEENLDQINWKEFDPNLFIKLNYKDFNVDKYSNNDLLELNNYKGFIIFKIYIPSIKFKNPLLILRNLNNDLIIYFNNNEIYKFNRETKIFKYPIFNHFINLRGEMIGNYIYLKVYEPENLVNILVYFGEKDDIIKKIFIRESFFLVTGIVFITLSFFILFLSIIFKLKDNSIFLIILLISIGIISSIQSSIKDIFYIKSKYFIYFFNISLFYYYIFPFLIIRKLIGLKLNLFNLYIIFSLILGIFDFYLFIKGYINYLNFYNIYQILTFINLFVIVFYIMIKKYFSDNYYKMLVINFLIFIFALIYELLDSRLLSVNYKFIYFFYINLFFTIIYLLLFFIRNYSNSLLDLDTGLFNKYYFDGQLDRNIKLCIREKKPISLIRIEILNINDMLLKEGEMKTNELQKKLGTIIKSVIKRSEDYVSIIGKGKFYVVLPFTDINGGKVVVENIVKAIKNKLNDISNIKIGLSFIYPKDISDKNTLLQKADYAAHVAKKENLEYYIRF